MLLAARTPPHALAQARVALARRRGDLGLCTPYTRQSQRAKGGRVAVCTPSIANSPLSRKLRMQLITHPRTAEDVSSRLLVGNHDES